MAWKNSNKGSASLTENIRSLEVTVKKQAEELTEVRERLAELLAQHRNHETLFKSNADNYRTILDNIQDGFFETSLSGRITFFNKAMLTLTQYTEDELFGMHYKKYTSERTAESLYDVFSRLYNTGKPTSIAEYELIDKDDKTKVLAISISLIRDNAGKPTGFRGIARDITDRKRVEQAQEQYRETLEKNVKERTAELLKTNADLLKAKEIADASAKAKSEFLANMSHEIRTPLNAIIGMSDLLMSTDQVHKQKDFLDIIRNASRSLLDLVNDILDYSKIDAGQLDFESIRFNLQEIIDELTYMFLEKNISKQLELIVDIHPDVPKYLSGDPLRLRQVLVNMVSNAFKFTEKGEICISVDVKERTGDDVELLFCIKDTGIGIDPELCQGSTLFEAFAQADGSTTRKYGGTGLGLAICKKIVTLMDGVIWVESKPGVGSAFYFTARMKELGKKENTWSGLPETLKNRKVLIVDDNPSTLMVIKRYMESFGFVPTLSESAEGAMKHYEQSRNNDPFSLILLDLRLRGYDGVKIAESIKQQDGKNAPPIIVISALGNKKDIMRAKNAGVESFLMKPVKQSLLFNTIMEVFGSEIVRPDTPEDPIPINILSGINLLLVEDNPINQMVVMEMIDHPDIRIKVAENGKEAIDQLKACTYDVVLMDIQMPEMDGLQATRKIRNILNLKKLPIIAMTAHAMYGDREKCIAAGMNDYIPKPVDRQLLLQTISRYYKSYREDISSGSDETNRIDLKSIQHTAPGLNLKDGVTRLAGSWDGYRRILLSFESTFRDFNQKTRMLIDEKKFDHLKMAIHNLKGTAGNISATELHLAAQSFEQTVQTQDYAEVLKQFPSISEPLDVVLTTIRKINEPYHQPEAARTKEAPENVDPVLVLDLCDHLSNSLKKYDPVETDNCLNQIIRLIPDGKENDTLKEILHEMELKTAAYDFEGAENILENFKTNLKKLETEPDAC